MQQHIKALRQFRAQQQVAIDQTDRALEILCGGVAVVHKKKRKHHRLTPEGRKRLSDGMRKRWAERRKGMTTAKVA